MTDSETYNGYANRETWAFNLHWQNDQGLYGAVLEFAEGMRSAWREDVRPGEEITALALGEAVLDFVKDDLPELSPALWESMRSDVGSFWRVDCKEVGEAVLEGLGDES